MDSRIIWQILIRDSCIPQKSVTTTIKAEMDVHLQFGFLSFSFSLLTKSAMSCDEADILHNVLHKFSHDGSRWLQRGGDIYWIKGSVHVLLWNLHSRGKTGRKRRECKFQNKAHAHVIFDPRNNSTPVRKCCGKFGFDGLIVGWCFGRIWIFSISILARIFGFCRIFRNL